MNYFQKCLIFIILVLASQLVFSQEGGVTQTDDEKYDGMKTNKLTDEDYRAAENFHHEGKANEIFNEGCKNSDYKDLCTEKEKSFRNNQNFIEDMIPAVSKMYGTLGLVGAGKIKTDFSKTDVVDKNGKNVTKKNGKVKQKKTSNSEEVDYCKYIPTAVEIAVAGVQQANNNSVQQSFVNDPKKRTNQRELILATADAHKSRKTTAKIQAVGYTSTAFCYAAYAYFASATGTGTYIKIAASAGLAFFYGKKAKHHNDRKKAIEEIAERLPVIGECAPQTQTNCFCSEESSKTLYAADYLKYCVPDEYKNALAENPISCVDANGQVDHACNCNKTGSCLNDRLAMVNPSLTGPAAILWKESMKGFDLINSGNFDDAKLGDYINGAGAMTQKALDQLDSKVNVPNINLSDQDKKIAKDLVSAGLPNKAAAMVSQSASKTPPGLDGMNAPSIASIKKELSKSGITFQNHSLGGGKKIKIHSGKQVSNAKPANPYAKFLNLDKNKAPTSASIEFVEYTKQAQREAEIVRRPETSIFKILSHRYKTTGKKKLQALEN